VLAALASIDGDPVVLVVDDAHTVTDPDVISDLEVLAKQLPRSVRLAVATRWDLPWRVARLRTEQRLVELRSDDLAFVQDEAAALLAGVSGRDVPDSVVSMLVERTDGWAVGLQLAAISLQSADDPATFAADFAGSDRLVAEYLTQEVLDSLDPATRRFLLDTSVLPWLCAELCDAVTGRTDSGEQLALLRRRSLFLLPLSASGERARYHHLFADLLRYQLEAERPSDVRHLREAAAAWMAQHGAHTDAIELLLAAGAWEAAFGQVRAVGQEYFETGRSATLVGWLRTIAGDQEPPGVDVEIHLLAAEVAAHEDPAAAETYRRVRRRADITPAEGAAADAVYACLGLDDLPSEEVLELARSSLAALQSVERDTVPDFLGIGGFDSVELMADYMRAVAEFHSGDVVGAAAALDRTRKLPGMSFGVWRLYVLGTLGLLRGWLGHLTEARQLATACLDSAEQLGLGRTEYVTHGFFAAALVAIERAERHEAERCLSESALRNRRRTDASFFDVQRHLEARAAVVFGEDDRALELLAAPARSSIEPAVLARANQQLGVVLLLRRGDPRAAAAVVSASVTPAAGAPLVDLALADGRTDEAQRLLNGWRPEDPDLAARVEHRLREAASHLALGDRSRAGNAVADAIALAAVERLRRPFLDVPALGPLLHEAAARPGASFEQSVVEATRARSASPAPTRLVEPLSRRELDVLGYLPSRLSNEKIATELYVSTNTVKSHVSSIYRKLGVSCRDDAVERAGELGLL
jgi:LuxR family maltose regulon positive regulatory protein